MTLTKIQRELKAPKSQYNNFGKYKYRNQEDILEAVKPLLDKYECSLTVTDDVVVIKDIITIKAVARFTGKDGSVTEVTAYAGIDTDRKGMDIAQCFGASSSYARKYALNGMFLIDDNKTPDTTNTHGATGAAPTTQKKQVAKPVVKEDEPDLVLKSLGMCESIDDLTLLWDSLDPATEHDKYRKAFGDVKAYINSLPKPEQDVLMDGLSQCKTIAEIDAYFAKHKTALSKNVNYMVALGNKKKELQP